MNGAGEGGGESWDKKQTKKQQILLTCDCFYDTRVLLRVADGGTLEERRNTGVEKKKGS